MDVLLSGGVAVALVNGAGAAIKAVRNRKADHVDLDAKLQALSSSLADQVSKAYDRIEASERVCAERIDKKLAESEAECEKRLADEVAAIQEDVRQRAIQRDAEHRRMLAEIADLKEQRAFDLRQTFAQIDDGKPLMREPDAQG